MQFGKWLENIQNGYYVSSEKCAPITAEKVFSQLRLLLHITNTFSDTYKIQNTYKSLPSAGPAFKTSEMAILGSPLVKWGLSRPPLTAMPNPYPGTRSKITW